MSALPLEFDPVPNQGIPALPVPVTPVVIVPAATAPAGAVEAGAAPASNTAGSNTPVSDTPGSDTPAAAQWPGVSPRRPSPRARPIGRRPHPVGVRACSAVPRTELASGAELTAVPPRRVQARPAAVPSSPPLRLTGRGRSAIAACGVVVATLLWFAIATAAHAAAHGTPVPGAPAHGAPAAVARSGMARIVVQPGQTLWSIATQADPSADPRLVVQRIVSVNKLTGESVAAGQRLWVPRG